MIDDEAKPEPIFVKIYPDSSNIGEKSSEDECMTFSKLFMPAFKLARFSEQRVSAYSVR